MSEAEPRYTVPQHRPPEVIEYYLLMHTVGLTEEQKQRFWELEAVRDEVKAVKFGTEEYNRLVNGRTMEELRELVESFGRDPVAVDAMTDLELIEAIAAEIYMRERFSR